AGARPEPTGRWSARRRGSPGGRRPRSETQQGGSDRSTRRRGVAGVLSFGEVIEQVGAEELVGAGVALGDEPGARRQVIPPLALDAGLAVAVEDVVGPLLVGGGGRIGHGAHLAAEGELLSGARAVDRAADDLHVRSCLPRSFRPESLAKIRASATGLLAPADRSARQPTVIPREDRRCPVTARGRTGRGCRSCRNRSG